MSKFKIGDRVRVVNISGNKPQRSLGEEFFIESDEGEYHGEQAWAGKGNPYMWPESDLELAQATSPVREVTKTITTKEIVDGTYGRVFCYSIGDDPKKVAVAFVKRGEEGHVDTPSFVLTEEELRAAAAVLLELAGALDT